MTTGVLIAALGLSLTLLVYVIKLATKMGQIMEQLTTVIQTVKENREDAEKNFHDLYAFKSDTQKILSRWTEAISNINSTLNEIKSDIKELRHAK